MAARLAELYAYAGARSPYYREALAGTSCPDGEELFDFWSGLPLTTRHDLAERNEDFCASPEADIREIVCTSGTKSSPISIYLTRQDLLKLEQNEWYAFQSAGFSSSDRVLLCVTMEQLFMAGMAYYLGLERCGCTVLRQGAGNPAHQAELIVRHRITGIVTVPSFLNAVVRALNAAGVAPNDGLLQRAVLVGENLRLPDWAPSALARSIREQWPVDLFGSYGNTEMCGSMAECEQGRGAHMHPDVVYAEIVDEAGTPLTAGEQGCLVVSTLNAEGTPLIRYKTGDIAFMDDTPCACGRFSPRLGPVIGREGDMLKIKGTKVYPSVVADLLVAIREVGEFVLEADQDENGSDRLHVHMTWRDGVEGPPGKIEEILATRLRTRPVIHILSQEQLNRMTRRPGYRKRISFIDRRKQQQG